MAFDRKGCNILLYKHVLLFLHYSIARIIHIDISVANGNLFRKQPSYDLMKFEVNNKSFLNVIRFFKNMQIVKKWRFLLLQNTVLYKHSFFFLQMTRSFDCLIPPMFKLTNLAFRECPHINMVCSTETQDHILKIAGYIFWLHILDTVNIEYKLVNKLINKIKHSVFEYFWIISGITTNCICFLFEDIIKMSCLVMVIRITKFHWIFAKRNMLTARHPFYF